jgi:hypothetical protein
MSYKIYKNGDTFTVTLSISNISNVDAENVEVAITNPIGVSLTGENTNGVGAIVNDSATLNTWTVPTLFAGQQLKLGVTYTIIDSTLAPWVISWVASTSSVEVNLNNNNTSVTVNPLTDYKLLSYSLGKTVVVSDAFYIVPNDVTNILVDNSSNAVEIMFDINGISAMTFDGGYGRTVSTKVIGVIPDAGNEVTIAATPGGVFSDAMELDYKFHSLGESISVIAYNNSLYIK